MISKVNPGAFENHGKLWCVDVAEMKAYGLRVSSDLAIQR